MPPDHKLHLRRRQFLNIVRVLAWDAEAADLYAGRRHGLETAGEPLGKMDMMISEHSLSVPAVLVTNNTRHFSRIQALLILENWQ